MSEEYKIIKRRIKLVEISPDNLCHMLKTTGDDCIIVDIKGIPLDAELKSTGYDISTDTIMCVFEHESFEEVEEGHRIPRLNIEITRYYV